MGIDFDWQIDDADAPWPEDQPPQAKSRRRLSRRFWLALSLILILVIASAAVYIQLTLVTQLDRTVAPVRQVASISSGVMKRASSGSTKL